MENIIILILFTYPGIMADYLHDQMVEKEAFHKDIKESFRTVRDFFLSAVITLVTISLFSLIMRVNPELQTIINEIQKDMNIWIYLIMSIVISVISAYVWHGINLLTLKRKNRKAERQNTFLESKWDKTWTALYRDRKIPYAHCVMAVYKDGKLIRAGLTHHVTENPEEDPWIALKFMTEAEEEINKPKDKRKVLIEPAYSFINLQNGTSVEIYDSRYFTPKIDEKYKF